MKVSDFAGTVITPVPVLGNFTDPVALLAGSPVSVPDTGDVPLSGTLAAVACCADTFAARSKEVTPDSEPSTDEGRATLGVFNVTPSGFPGATDPANASVALTVTGALLP